MTSSVEKSIQVFFDGSLEELQDESLKVLLEEALDEFLKMRNNESIPEAVLLGLFKRILEETVEKSRRNLHSCNAFEVALSITDQKKVPFLLKRVLLEY